MNASCLNFSDVFASRTPGIIGFVGGGGKTGLLFALAESLLETGAPVVATTTTRMYRPASASWLEIDIADHPAFPPRKSKALFIAKPPGEKQDRDKVFGYDTLFIDALAKNAGNAWILVEADGAAGHPLKAPAAHEPAAPLQTRYMVAVIGLSGVNQPFSSENVFRTEAFSAVTGLRPGDIVTPSSLTPLVAHPEGLFKGTPAGAQKFVFCNQSDVSGALENGNDFAAAIRHACPESLDGFFVGSLRTKGLECLSYPMK